ncbi:unnamed protein product, partial [Ectocarpus sp. 8 AP-2014]
GERQEDQAVHRQASRRRRPIHVHPVTRVGADTGTGNGGASTPHLHHKGDRGSSDWEPPPASRRKTQGQGMAAHGHASSISQLSQLQL